MNLTEAILAWARLCSSDATGTEIYKRQPFYKPELVGYRETSVPVSDIEIEAGEAIARIVKRLEKRDSEGALALRCKHGALYGGRSMSPRERAEIYRRETGQQRREMYRKASMAEVYLSGAWDQ